MSVALTSTRLPRSGNAALASGALIQAVVGFEFVLSGLSKFIDAEFLAQFRTYVQASPGASSGPLAGMIQALVIPYSDVMAQLSRSVELGAGLILLLTSLEVARRRLSGVIGEQVPYEPMVALLSCVAAFALGGMSLSIYVLQGGQWPVLNSGYPFASPIAIELFLVPLALAIAILEFARFIDMRKHSRGCRVPQHEAKRDAECPEAAPVSPDSAVVDVANLPGCEDTDVLEFFETSFAYFGDVEHSFRFISNVPPA